MINKFFIKRFRTFFLFMIIPTVIVFVMFTIFTGNQFNSDLKTQGGNSLSGIQTNFDVVVRNAVYQQNLMTNDHKMMLSLQKLLMSNGSYDYSDDIFLEDLEATLRSIVYSHSYIDSIYLYLDGYDDFFSSEQNGITPLQNYYDADWYEDYRKDTPQHSQWIVRRSISQYSDAPQAVLTVFQRMSSINGVIVINIDEKKFISILNSIVTDKNEYVYMLDNNYSMILCNRGNAGPERNIENGYLKKYMEKSKKSLSNLSGNWLRIGGKSYLLNYLNYPESQVKFVSLISNKAMYAQYEKVIVDFVLILFGNCILVFFLSYFTTKRIFRQINYMIQVFSDAEKGLMPKPPKKKVEDEYDIIMNNIIHLYIKTTQINNQLTERQYRLEVTELKALQLQINPHFLLNTLQTMDLEAIKLFQGNSPINDMIHNLSDILKYALGDPTQPVSLRDELTYLKEYVNIQKYRFGDRFIVYYEIDEKLLDCHVFRLMLQPLLENSIIHGVRPLDKMGYIKIKVTCRDRYLQFRVIDNGVGITKTEISALYSQINDENSKSIGLTNVNRRLILEYGNDCGLHIHSKKGMGTGIFFKVPVQKVSQNRKI